MGNSMKEIEMIKEQVSLYFKSGSSDKEYHTQLVKKGNAYIVDFQFGRRGSTLQTGTKTPDAVSLEEATKIYTKLVKSKLAKGYSEGTAGTPFKSADLSDKSTGIFPQLLNELTTEQELQAMIEDDDFVAQEKFDGERRMTQKNSKVLGINKKGLKVILPSNIAESIRVESLLDAEIVGDHLYVFDLLSLKGKSFKKTPYDKRLKLLGELEFGDSITVVETAVGTQAKKEMLKKLKKENREGIIFKRKKHLYKEGRPNSGGDVFKFKFYKTSTCRVANHTKGKRSVGLEMLEENKAISVGKVTIPPNKSIPEIGAYIEVRYLYAYKGGSLYQPTYQGERTDQDDSDISLNQLVYKATKE